MKKIKVLHVSQAPIGGPTQNLKLLFENYTKSKFEHYLICPSHGNMYEMSIKKGIGSQVLEMKREISFFYDLNHIFKLRKMIKKINPDILYLHCTKAGVLGRIAVLGLHKKVVYNPRGWSFKMDISNKKKLFYAFIEKCLSYVTDKIILVSKDEFELAIKYRISAKKMCIIHNGIELDRFKNEEKEKFKDKLVLGFVGRLTKAKNPFFLIDIVKKLKSKIDKFVIYIVGDGELKDEFVKNIKNNNLEQYFYFANWSEKVEEEMKNFDIGLIVSKWEGFSVVQLEYMAAKKPIISIKNIGGVKNVLTNNKNSILCEKYDPIEFSNSIIKLKNDDKLKEKIVKNAYELACKEYSIGKTVIELENLFCQLLSKGKKICAES